MNPLVFIASQVEADATVTEYPSAAAAVASALDDPPFTLVDKISTDTDDALAGTDPATTPAAVTAPTPAATTDAGTATMPAAAITGASTTRTRRGTARRTCRRARRTSTVGRQRRRTTVRTPDLRSSDPLPAMSRCEKILAIARP